MSQVMQSKDYRQAALKVVLQGTGKTAQWYASDDATWYRRGFPLFLRFVCNAPALGSAMGVINLYIGLGKSILETQSAVKKQVKYWSYLHALHWGAAKIGSTGHCARLRLLPGQAIAQLRNSPRITNHQKGAIEASKKNIESQIEAGIKDAIETLNRMLEATEQALAQKLMSMVQNNASYAQRQQAYHGMAKELRTLAAEGLVADFISKIPPRHVQTMLNY